MRKTVCRLAVVAAALTFLTPLSAQVAQAALATATTLTVKGAFTAPRDVAATAADHDTIHVAWTPSADATSYRVNAAVEDRMRIVASGTTGSGQRELALTGVRAPAGASVRVWVEANEGPWTTASATVGVELPSATASRPKIVKADQRSARVRWAVAPNATAYDVQVATEPQFRRPISTHTVAERTATLEGLAPGRRYYIRVRAYAGSVAAPYGPAATFDTPRPPVRPRSGAAPTTHTPHTNAPAGGPSTVRVATWNICSQACPGYQTRAPIAAQRLAEANVDVFALQEAGGKKVAPRTDAFFGQNRLGYLRAKGGDGRGFIFYRPTKYTQTAGGHVPLGGDRHMSWARLTDQRTGAPFVVAGIHLTSGKDSVDARRATELTVALASLRTLASGLPTVLMGDFNTGPHRAKDTPSRLLREGGFADARTISSSPPVGDEYNSAHSWDPSDLRKHSDHIDRIMVSADLKVAGWKQLLHLTGDQYSTPMVSDHNAVTADLVLPPL